MPAGPVSVTIDASPNVSSIASSSFARPKKREDDPTELGRFDSELTTPEPNITAMRFSFLLFLSSLPSFALLACYEESSPRPQQQPQQPPPQYYGPPQGAPPPGYGQPPPPQAGPPCIEQSYACSPDRAVMLQCRAGRFVLASTCRGPKACVDAQAIACDHTLAAPGDACDDQGGIACSMDRKSVVRCQNGVYLQAEACRNACLSTGSRVLCQ
jgi:hypothetical protein